MTYELNTVGLDVEDTVVTSLHPSENFADANPFDIQTSSGTVVAAALLRFTNTPPPLGTTSWQHTIDVSVRTVTAGSVTLGFWVLPDGCHDTDTWDTQNEAVAAAFAATPAGTVVVDSVNWASRSVPLALEEGQITGDDLGIMVAPIDGVAQLHSSENEIVPQIRATFTMDAVVVHNIDASTMDLGPIASIDAGDITLNAVAGPTSYPHVVDSAGRRVLRCDGAMAFMVDTGGPATWPSPMITFALVADFHDAYQVWVRSGTVEVNPTSETPFVVMGVPLVADIPTGLHSWVMTSDASGSRLICDGVTVAAGEPGEGPVSGFTFLYSDSSADIAIARGWQVAFSEADAQALSLELLVGTGVQLQAEGTWNITGSATISTGLWEPPAIPPATRGGSATPPPPPEPQDPPPGVPATVITRHSEVMPAPVLDDKGFPVDWHPSSVVHAPYGVLQIVVEGVDVTYWADAPTPFPTWSRVEPFGSEQATLTFPQITAHMDLPDWCMPGAAVDIRFKRTNGDLVHCFAGAVDTFNHREDDGVFTVEARGVVFVDDLQLRPPAFLTAPRDIGDVVADVLNTSVSRRHHKIDPVVTGCETSVLGGWEPRVTGYVQQLLATAVKKGRQWTVKCEVRSPVIELKDTDTIHWSVTNGQRGIAVDLTQDWSQAPNAIYGEGISPTGGRWRNAMYPNWRPDNTPAYPNSSPTATLTVGSTDSGTTSGRGVSDWQRRVGQPVTGTFSQDDRARAFEVQRAAGIQQDGIVGPQTWAASFGTGSNTGTLDCFFLPIAYAPEVMPRTYGPDGDDLGVNPDYDEDILRVDDKIDFGQGVTKKQGKAAARETLAREINPGWSGTITLTADPEEMSRFDVREGQNVRIRRFRGKTVVAHVAGVEFAEDSVRVTVDTNARDYPTLDAIKDRERNATDPAKALIKRLNKGSVTDARATFDAESPAGEVPKHALFPNLWTVIRVPFGSYGQISRTTLTTTGSASAFAVAVFAEPITAGELLALVGNPLTAEDNPWSDKADELADRSMMMAWGWRAQPCGYYPKEYSNPETSEDAAPVTGRFVDDASWDYASAQPPWVWVAEIASAGCYIEGRFLPGVDS